jgi:glutathione S-transferase
MSIVFFYGSGSPYAWKVWLALEHKQLPYDLRALSFQAGEMHKPEFLKINPRGMVPALTDGDHIVFESSVIIEYLEDAYPARPLLPRVPGGRAHARRVGAEADLYFGIAVRRLLRSTLFRRAGDGDPREIAASRDALAPEIVWAERTCADGFVTGEPSAADYSIYPWLAMLRRLEERQPDHGFRLPASLRRYMGVVESLPFLERTIPPHWK